MEDMRERVKEEARSIGRYVSDLAGEVGTLVRQEFDLARSEMAEKAKEAKGGAVKLGVGSAVMHAGALTFAAAAVVGLTLLFRQWMSPLEGAFLSTVIVGIVFAVVGYSLVRKGARDLSPEHFVPNKTIECIKQNARFAQEKAA